MIKFFIRMFIAVGLFMALFMGGLWCFRWVVQSSDQELFRRMIGEQPYFLTYQRVGALLLGIILIIAAFVVVFKWLAIEDRIRDRELGRTNKLR